MSHESDAAIPVSDALAAERTMLAAERTFLAYLRTSFAMFAAGLTGAHFLKDALLTTTAYSLVALSVVLFGIGAWRYRGSRLHTLRLLARLKRESVPPLSR